MISETASFNIGVFTIILDEQEHILLCHRRDCDLWNLPGGGLENIEAPWQGAIREVKEETGLDIEIIKLADISSKSDKNVIVFTFLGRIVGGELQITDESDKCEYFSIDNLPKNISPKQAERIKDIIADKNRIYFRIQSGKSIMELIKEGKL